ncbi:MAG TPA: response regulator [Clostridia bacterium]|nr:response regulator [Clostridia bacterium]
MTISLPAHPTVLYVEDEENDLLLMQMAFRKVGLDQALKAVGDGREAMDYLSGRGAYSDRTQHPLPQVILLDLNLPVISGFEVLGWLRRCPGLQDLPVVVFTSSSRAEDKQKAQELGANDYLEKPTSFHHFGQVVEGVRQKWLA